MIFDLPYPPTVNLYYRHVGAKVLISSKGRQYRKDVEALVAAQGRSRLDGQLEVTIDVYPPDRRKRDLDNTLKSLLDSLQHAGVYADDSQIRRIDIQRMGVVPGGKAVVKVEEAQQ